MDERLKKYLEYVENPVDIDPPGKEVVEAWIDYIINALKTIEEFRKQFIDEIPFGKFSATSGDWENEISVCGFGPVWIDGRVHFYRGLEYVAKILGLDVECSKRSNDEYEYSCQYKGHKLFQLEEERWEED
jgi:hypothetical protein